MRNGAVALLWPSLPPSLPLSPSLPRMAVRGSDSDLSLPLPLLARCLRDTTVLISQHAEPSRHSTAAAAAAVQQHQAVCVLAAAARARPSEFQLLEPPLTDELLVLSDASRGARRGDLFRRVARRRGGGVSQNHIFCKDK